MIEAGFVHARALLEFLGLSTADGNLAQVKRRRRDDIGIETFSNAQGPLCLVHPDEAVAAYLGPKKDAEAALVSIFELANKGLAHVSGGSYSQIWTDEHLDVLVAEYRCC